MNNNLIQPFGLNVVRVGITAILLWVMFLFKPEKKLVSKADGWRFFLCGLTGIAVNQLLFLKGLQLTYPIQASLLMLATPIIIAVLAAIVLKEKLTTAAGIGIFLGLTGAVLLITRQQTSGNASNPALGNLLVIINAASYAIYFILVKPLMEKYPPIQVLRIVFTIGFFIVLPFGFSELMATPWDAYQLNDAAALFIIIIGGTFLAYLFNIYGIRQVGASVAGSYIYAQPVFAAIIAILVLGEKLTVYELIAAVLIFSGLFFANSKKSV